MARVIPGVPFIPDQQRRFHMNFDTSYNSAHARLRVRHVAAPKATPDLADDVRRGLLEPPRWLPPKYFYDERGAELFEAICATPEYYPSRTEEALLLAHASHIVDAAGARHLVELGSGSARKTRHLLDAYDALGRPCVYWPFDVSAGMLVESSRALVRDYPWLRVHALVGDYLGGLRDVGLPRDGEGRLFAFLGGTIGNFEEWEASTFLREIRALMDPNDRLLLGADRVKDRAVLTAAYNDSQGVTAAFNKNVLEVLNRGLAGDFDPACFEHEAVYNAESSRIEMYLEVQQNHTVTLQALEHTLVLEAGERICTEVSRKFSTQALRHLLATGDLRMEHHYEAADNYYSLVLAAPA